MKLDYGTQLSSLPIKLSIGTIRKPTLHDIAELSFDKYNLFRVLMTTTPAEFYDKVKISEGRVIWENKSKEEKEKTTMFDMIKVDNTIRSMFVEMFSFFFLEKVVYIDGYFVLLKDGVEYSPEKSITVNDICGSFGEKNFAQVLSYLQQICGVYDETQEEDISKLKFKNEKAKEIYLKTQRGRRKRIEAAKFDINLSIPNIISSVATRHSSINPTNVWQLTLFQLLDTFARLQVGAIYDLDSARVSAWGDEKKTFNPSLWYTNSYDK